MERPGALEEQRLALRPLGVGHAAVDRADLGARLLVVEDDALGALLGDDVEDVVGDGRMHRAIGRLPFHAALVDGGVGALRLAGPAVDAFAGDHGRHRVGSSTRGCRAWCRRLPSAKSLTFFGRWVKPRRDLWAPGARVLERRRM